MSSGTSKWLLVLARCVVGATFLLLGLIKALDPVGFLKLVRQFDVLTAPPALNLVAAVLPWFEIFCGVLLILGIKPRASAALQAALLAGFTVLIVIRALAVQRATGTPFCAISFDCGCGTGVVRVCLKLVENVALLLLAVVVAAVPQPAWCLWPDHERVQRRIP